MNSIAQTPEERLALIRTNTTKWKGNGIVNHKDEQFRLLNNGACMVITKEQYENLLAQYGVSADDIKDELVHLYLGIDTSGEDSGDDFNKRKGNLICYMTSDKYDESIDGGVEKNKIIIPDIIGDWLGRGVVDPPIPSEKKGRNEIKYRLFVEDDGKIRQPSEIGEDDTTIDKRIKVVMRTFEWKVYGSNWNDESIESEQVFEFKMKNLCDIFGYGPEGTIEVVIFFSMNDYNSRDPQLVPTPPAEELRNRIELCFCAKRELLQNDIIKEFLDFYAFENVSTPYPPYSMADKSFNLLSTVS